MSKPNSREPTLNVDNSKHVHPAKIFAAIAGFVFLASFNSPPSGSLIAVISLPTAAAQLDLDELEKGIADLADRIEIPDVVDRIEIPLSSLTTEDDDGEPGDGEEVKSRAPETEKEMYEVEPQRAQMPAYEPSVTTEEDDPEETPVDSTGVPAQPISPELED